MPSSVKYSGICSTCRNAPTCSYLERRKSPVLQCEEFECYEPPLEKKHAPALRPPDSSDAAAGKSRDSDEYKGLCMDCEYRNDCTYPKPEGGVWHCGEYR